MKKTILTLFAVALIVPHLAFAQATNTTTPQPQKSGHYVAKGQAFHASQRAKRAAARKARRAAKAKNTTTNTTGQ